MMVMICEILKYGKWNYKQNEECSKINSLNLRWTLIFYYHFRMFNKKIWVDNSAARPGYSVRGRTHRWGRASLGVRVAEPPGRRRIFEIIQIICQEISKICINLAYFSTKLNNHWVNCLPFWRKNTKCWEILRCVQKLSKDFLRKFQKVHYFSIFSKN